MKPFLLEPIHDYTIWGTNHISKARGIDEDYGTWWEVSAHPYCSNKIIGTNKTLMKMIQENPDEVLGKGFTLHETLRLAYLDTKDALSIQVHPEDDYALEHSNDYGKYESWYILDAKPGATLVAGTTINDADEIKNALMNNDVEKYLKNVRYDEFILGDIEEIDIPKIDTTVSSSVFQWLKNFSKSIEKIAHSTNELGFSMYIDGNLEEIKEHFGISLKYLTLDNVIEILTSLFSKVKWKEETIELEFSSSIEALRHLKNTGVTGFEKSSISKVRNYESKSLTYRVGYFYCKK